MAAASFIVAWALVGVALTPLVEAAIIALPARASLRQTLAALLSDRRTLGTIMPIGSAALKLALNAASAASRPPNQRGKETPDALWKPTLRRLLTEAGLICTFAWLAWQHGPGWLTFVLSVYAVAFSVIIGTDLEHHLILNQVIAPAAAFALLVSATLPQVGLTMSLLGAAAGFMLMLLPALIMPGGLGAGDVKLAGLLGLATGLSNVLIALAMGVVLGGIVTVLLLVTRRIGRRDYVPYGPFLIAGGVLIFMQW